MKYQEWLNGCGCCPDIQDCPPSTGNPCDCDSILLELSKQHTDDLVLQDEIDNLDEKKLDASAYTPDEYATEEWVNEQGFLKTVEPLKTINGESLIGEGDIVISGGSGDAYTKAETDALLDEKVNVVDNEVPQFIAQGDMLTRYYPASGTPETVFANMPVKMKVRTSGWEPQSIDDIIYINDENGFVASGNCASRNQGVLTPSIPSELQPYLTVRFISGFYEGLNNLFEAKEGYRISYVDATMTDGSGQFEPGITPYFVAYEGGQSADVIKDVIEPTLINKQDTLIAGDYITIDSANTISTSGLVTVEDNEVDASSIKVNEIEDRRNIQQSFIYGAADVMSFDWYGRSSDQTNGLIIFNEEGETIGEANNQGFRWDVYNNSFILKDIYTENGNVTLDEVDVQSGSCHFKISTHNGWFIKYVNSYNRSGYDDGVKAVFYKSFNGGQSADVIENVIEPYLGKLIENKFDKDFTCNDPLIYDSTYKRFSIKTSDQRYNTISASTSATTNLARAYDVKTYVESKIASGITSGDVQTMIDESISGKQDTLIAGDYITIDSTNTISTSGLVTVADNEVPDYNVTNEITYQGGYPSQTETASTWDDASMFALKYNFFKLSDTNYTTTAAVIDPSGNITTGNVTTDEYRIGNPLPDYIDMIREGDDISGKYYFTAKEGYRIAHLDIYSSRYGRYGAIIEERAETVFEGGQSADVIKDVIEPELLKKQDTLASGENIKTINNISILGSGNIDVQSLANVPVYSGSALASVSINNPSGLDNGYNRISGRTSVGAGYMVETRNVDEAAFGVYNLSNSENSQVFDYSSGSTLFSVGNGHPHTTGGYIRKHNAFEIRQNGDIYYTDTNAETEYPYEQPMIKLQDVIKNLQNEINSLKAQINGN